MSDQIIIMRTSPIHCFHELMTGTLQITVNNVGTNSFPTQIIADTNRGRFVESETLSGNQTFVKKVGIATITIVISDWVVSYKVVSFNFNISFKIGSFNCTALDQVLIGYRTPAPPENSMDFEGLLSDLNAQS